MLRSKENNTPLEVKRSRSIRRSDIRYCTQRLSYDKGCTNTIRAGRIVCSRDQTRYRRGYCMHATFASRCVLPCSVYRLWQIPCTVSRCSYRIPSGILHACSVRFTVCSFLYCILFTAEIVDCFRGTRDINPGNTGMEFQKEWGTKSRAAITETEIRYCTINECGDLIFVLRCCGGAGLTLTLNSKGYTKPLL